MNYFLLIHEAVQENQALRIPNVCYFIGFKDEMSGIDGYIRRRLRVAMIHKHPTQRKGQAMKTKWNNEFFARIDLIPPYWLYYHKVHGLTWKVTSLK